MMRALRYCESTRGAEARFRHPDGTARWLSLSAEPVFLDGNQFGAMLVIQDIDSEKRRLDWLPAAQWIPRLVRT
jgi:PAS domain S-box-containing protein